jgi:hypothetical protein
MNLTSQIVQFPKRYKKITKPFYVVRCDDHFMVCTIDDNGDLIEEVSVIHWNKFVVRRWAIEFAKEASTTPKGGVR